MENSVLEQRKNSCSKLVKIVIIKHVYRNLKETGVFCFAGMDLCDRDVIISVNNITFVASYLRVHICSSVHLSFVVSIYIYILPFKKLINLHSNFVMTKYVIINCYIIYSLFYFLCN